MRVEPTEEARAAAYQVTGYSDYGDDYFGGSSAEPVALDDFDFGSYQN